VADELSKKGPQDSSRVNVHEPHELRYWTKRFGVTEEQLKKAVAKVGTSVKSVESELKRR
jgi:hypothetical protein